MTTFTKLPAVGNESWLERPSPNPCQSGATPGTSTPSAAGPAAELVPARAGAKVTKGRRSVGCVVPPVPPGPINLFEFGLDPVLPAEIFDGLAAAGQVIVIDDAEPSRRQLR